MAARRAACLVEPTHRVASRGGHDLPLSAREPLEAHRVARRGGSGWRLARLAGRRPADGALGRALRGPLPQDEFDWIFSRVPRLTVEVVMASSDRGVLLALRDFGPCKGLWHLPGGTVRFGEPVTGAVRRVALDELGLTVALGSCSATSSTPATTTTASIHRSAWRSARTQRSPRCLTSAICDPNAPGSQPFPTTCTTSRRSSSPGILAWPRARAESHDIPVRTARAELSPPRACGPGKCRPNISANRQALNAPATTGRMICSERSSEASLGLIRVARRWRRAPARAGFATPRRVWCDADGPWSVRWTVDDRPGEDLLVELEGAVVGDHTKSICRSSRPARKLAKCARPHRR